MHDEYKDFLLVKSNIKPGQKNNLLSFLKHIETSFSDALTQAISYRIDLVELNTYTINCEAEKGFNCEMFFITYQDSDCCEEICELIQQVERICFEWATLKVNWTIIKAQKLL